MVSDVKREQLRLDALLATFPLYTTPVGPEFVSLGIVSGIAVMGANVFRDVFAGLTDIVGGRSGKYQSVIASGRDLALAEMCDEAQQRGAELVAGVTVDIDPMNGMFVISAMGTAFRHPDPIIGG